MLIYGAHLLRNGAAAILDRMMGQGLLTYIRQVAAYTLNIPLDMIDVIAARTAVIPNPTSTGGSTGTPYNAEAVKRLFTGDHDGKLLIRISPEPAA